MKVKIRRSALKKKRKSGYRARAATKAGRKIIKKRRQRGRAPVSAV
jgi:large subunit ribosomal protein L34